MIETIIPPGTTHLHEFYGNLFYYKKVTSNHLNQAIEEWQILTSWLVWNHHTKKWEDVGIGFSSRNLQAVEDPIPVKNDE